LQEHFTEGKLCSKQEGWDNKQKLDNSVADTASQHSLFGSSAFNDITRNQDDELRNTEGDKEIGHMPEYDNKSQNDEMIGTSTGGEDRNTNLSKKLPETTHKGGHDTTVNEQEKIIGDRDDTVQKELGNISDGQYDTIGNKQQSDTGNQDTMENDPGGQDECMTGNIPGGGDTARNKPLSTEGDENKIENEPGDTGSQAVAGNKPSRNTGERDATENKPENIGDQDVTGNDPGSHIKDLKFKQESNIGSQDAIKNEPESNIEIQDTTGISGGQDDITGLPGEHSEQQRNDLGYDSTKRDNSAPGIENAAKPIGDKQQQTEKLPPAPPGIPEDELTLADKPPAEIKLTPKEKLPTADIPPADVKPTPIEKPPPADTPPAEVEPTSKEKLPLEDEPLVGTLPYTFPGDGFGPKVIVSLFKVYSGLCI